MKSRRITALFTLLTILIAPLCAPFCHSHICAASPSEHNDGCHSSSLASDDVRHLVIAAFHVCAGQELPTAVLNEATSSPELARQQYAPHTSLHFIQAPSVLLAPNGAPPLHPNNESRIESSSVRPSVLRI